MANEWKSFFFNFFIAIAGSAIIAWTFLKTIPIMIKAYKESKKIKLWLYICGTLIALYIFFRGL